LGGFEFALLAQPIKPRCLLIHDSLHLLRREMSVPVGASRQQQVFGLVAHGFGSTILSIYIDEEEASFSVLPRHGAPSFGFAVSTPTTNNSKSR
jgi:hypothetical protein